MTPFELEAPTDKAELLARLAQGGEAQIIAGGTGILNLMKQRLASPEYLISLHKVAGLDRIEWRDSAALVGATRTLLEFETDCRDRIPVMVETLTEVASPRIRAMATLGGAVAHGDPNQDTPVTLTALDAIIHVESARGTRTIPMDELYLDYYETTLESDELVTSVEVPLPNAGSRVAFSKFTPGSVEDYAVVSVCVRLVMNEDGSCVDSRVALGAVGPTILRARAAEAVLNGSTIDEQLARVAGERAAELTDPIGDARGSAAYKTRMAAVVVRRTILAALGDR